jgi:tRNA(fMet)-specific endonuclease VapC
MTHLVDTDRVVDYLKGRPDARTQLSNLLNEGLSISIITYGEVYEGIFYGSDPAANERIFRSFLKGVRVLPVSQSVARRFARLRGDLRQRGLLLPMPDLLIAATALHYDLTLITRNLRHFERITDLRLITQT